MRRVFSVVVVGVFAAMAAFLITNVVARDAVSAPYSQIVDNASGRFSAPGWSTSSYSAARYGKDYGYSSPKKNGKPALYRVDRPGKGDYSVYARWPANSGYNGSARFGISTTSGMKWKTVSQRKAGGRWVKLGVYSLKAGDSNVIQVSRSSRTKGYIIADAVQVVRGNNPPASGTSASGGSGGGSSGGSGGGNQPGLDGVDVVQEAKTWLGTPYRYGGTSKSGVDCSGLSYSVFGKLGVSLPRVAADQYNGGPGTKVGRSDLQRGYLVFGHADGGSGIQHVGIVTGDGRMIHAPQPGTVVRYDSLPASWYNIVGVKRIVSAG